MGLDGGIGYAAAMTGRDAAGDAQAQAAVEAVRSAFFCAVEALKNAFAVFRGDAGAVVFNAEHDFTPFPLRDDAHMPASRRVADGVVHVIPLTFVYIAIFKSLLTQYRIQTERQSAALLTVQIAALKEKVQKVKEVEEEVRIQRHDLRHQLQAVTELVAQGAKDTALEFLNAAQKRLDEQKVRRWCSPAVLDAVFSSYFGQAQKAGIRVNAKISMAGAPPVDEGELAIVVANALENAIHACMELPAGQREIRCKMVSTPGLMLEISNPCTGDLAFDGNGLPVTQRANHGLGVQSISAFCRKTGAVYRFNLIDGWFHLMLVL